MPIALANCGPFHPRANRNDSILLPALMRRICRRGFPVRLLTRKIGAPTLATCSRKTQSLISDRKRRLRALLESNSQASPGGKKQFHRCDNCSLSG